MLKNFKKTVIVTGGATGIGRQICIDFSKLGYNVCIGYNSSEVEAQSLETELLSKGVNCIKCKADITLRREVDNLMDKVITEFGSIDVLVNNAGICQYKLFTEISESDFNNMLNVNLLGIFNTTQSALKKYMINKKEGSIINISSIWGITGGSCETHYSMTKAGVIGFSKALAKELSLSNITVNVVAPGVIETDMISNLNEVEKQDLIDQIPLSRLGKPEDVSGAVVFLASESARYITGQVISPNGGMVI